MLDHNKIMESKMDSNATITIKSFSQDALVSESEQYHGTGGTSQGNDEFGFIPAFCDTANNIVYLSRSADGQLAKVHLLDGMPEHLIVSRDKNRVTAVEKSVVAGFVLNQVFFTRDEAARFVTEHSSKSA